MDGHATSAGPGPGVGPGAGEAPASRRKQGGTPCRSVCRSAGAAVRTIAAVTSVCGVLWASSPWWGVFTDRLPSSVAWLLPSAQATWPAGLLLTLAAAAGAAAAGAVRGGPTTSRSVFPAGHRPVLTGPAFPVLPACAVAVAVCVAVVVPGMAGRAASAQPGPKAPGDLRILAVNTWYGAASDTVLARTAADMDADVVVLPESSGAEAEAVARATGLHLVQQVSTRSRGGGTALLVRSTQLVDGSVTDLHLTRHQNPVARLTTGGQGDSGPADAGTVTRATGPVVTVTGVHTNAPAHSDLVDGWIREMGDLRDFAAVTPGPLVMAGDFNATTAHPEFRRLTKAPGGDVPGLVDCGGGMFAAPTWPRAGVPVAPVPLLRLDHVLVRGLACAASGVVGVEGSDHAGVWADLRP